MNKDNALTIVRIGTAAVAVVNNQALELMQDPEEKGLIKAALAPRIDAVPAKEAVTEMVAILTTTYSLAGQKADAGSLALYADEFYQRVMRIYPHVTLEEVRAALRNGVYDEYGDYFGLNPKSLIHFLSCYVKSEKRALAAENFNKAKALLAEPVVNQEDQDKETAGYVNQLYAKFLAGDLDINFLPAFTFDFLSRKGLLSDTLDYNAAKVYYTQHLDKGRPMNRSKAWIEAQRREKESAVSIVAKQMAVWHYFSLCQAHKQDAIIPEK